MKSYLMVGSGGTGTHLLPPLIPYLITHNGEEPWRLGIMDGDDVEEHNLARQLFHPAAVTMNKAKAAALPYAHMQNIFAIPEYLGAENIGNYIEDGTTVLICVDNFPVRALIESHCNTLQDVTVINGGNERDTGSCQVWTRKDGQNTTPALSFNHPEIFRPGYDRSLLSCAEISALPGGEQLIVTNMQSALFMLQGLMAVEADNVKWTETQFDALNPTETYAMDYRDLRGWN